MPASRGSTREVYAAFLEAQIQEHQRRRRGFLAPKIGHPVEDNRPTPPGGGALPLLLGDEHDRYGPRRGFPVHDGHAPPPQRQPPAPAMAVAGRRKSGVAVQFGDAPAVYPYALAHHYRPGGAPAEPTPPAAGEARRRRRESLGDAEGGLWRLGLGEKEQARRAHKHEDQGAYRSALDNQVRQHVGPPDAPDAHLGWRGPQQHSYQPAYAMPPPPQPFAQQHHGPLSAPVTPAVAQPQHAPMRQRPRSGGPPPGEDPLWRLGFGGAERGRRDRKNAAQHEYRAALDHQMQEKSSITPPRQRNSAGAKAPSPPARGVEYTAPGERVSGRDDFSYGRLGPRDEEHVAQQQRKHEQAMALQLELNRQIAEKRRQKEEEERQRRESDRKWLERYGAQAQRSEPAPDVRDLKQARGRMLAEKLEQDRVGAAEALRDPRFAPVRRRYHHERSGPKNAPPHEAPGATPQRQPLNDRAPPPEQQQQQQQQHELQSPSPPRGAPRPPEAPPPPWEQRAAEPGGGPPPEPPRFFWEDPGALVGAPAPPPAPTPAAMSSALDCFDRLSLRNRHRLHVLSDLAAQLHYGHSAGRNAERVLRDFIRIGYTAEPAWLYKDEPAASPPPPAGSGGPLLLASPPRVQRQLREELSACGPPPDVSFLRNAGAESPQGWAAGALAVDSTWVEQAPPPPPPLRQPAAEVGVPTPGAAQGGLSPARVGDDSELCRGALSSDSCVLSAPDASRASLQQPGSWGSAAAAPPPQGAARVGPPAKGRLDDGLRRESRERVKEGDRVRARLPTESHQPEPPEGVVTGHARGRVGVLLDSGLAVGVGPQDLIFLDEDEDGLRWHKVFPKGTHVEIFEHPVGGDPNNGRIGRVTGTARGRVSVEIDGRSFGFAENQLRPPMDYEDSDELAAKHYPKGCRVLVVDATEGQHGRAGTVTGHYRGRIGVAFDDGKLAGLNFQQLARTYDDEDQEEQNLASRWTVGMEVLVCDPPTGGHHNGKIGVVQGYSRGRIGVRVTGRCNPDGTEQEVSYAEESIGVAPSALRRHHKHDDDEDGTWLPEAYPKGARVAVLGLQGGEHAAGRPGVQGAPAALPDGGWDSALRQGGSFDSAAAGEQRQPLPTGAWQPELQQAGSWDASAAGGGQAAPGNGGAGGAADWQPSLRGAGEFGPGDA